MTDYCITAGDLKPDLTVICTNGVATFDTATSWRLTIETASGEIIDNSPTVVVSDDGHTASVSHIWQTGETDEVDRANKVKAKCVWPDGSPQSFPPCDWLTFPIAP